MVKTASPVEISWKSIDKPRIGYNGYQGFHPGKQETFKKGHVNKGWDDKPGKPLKCDIVRDNDVEIVMRDGTKLYGDIYRPAHQEGKIPCILLVHALIHILIASHLTSWINRSWSCFGKKHSGHTQMPKVPWNCGVRQEDISGFEKFEGVGKLGLIRLKRLSVAETVHVDPCEFCNWGYAVANVDSRGSGDSEGEAYMSESRIFEAETFGQAMSRSWDHKTVRTAPMLSNFWLRKNGAMDPSAWRAIPISPLFNTSLQRSNRHL